MPYEIGYLSEFNPELSNSNHHKPILLSALEKTANVLPIFCGTANLREIEARLPSGAKILARTIGSAANASFTTLRENLEKKGFAVINRLTESRTSKDKMKTYQILLDAGLLTIPTYAIAGGSPIPSNHIVKPKFGMKGDSILFGSIDLEQIPDTASTCVPLVPVKEWILQPYIPDSKNWWRVLVVNGKAIAVYKRIPAAHTSVANVSKGATRKFIDNPENEVIDLALEASKVAGLDICGVDITSFPHMVVEVNSVPAIPQDCAREVSLEILRLAHK